MALFICYIFCTLFYFSLFLYQLVSLNAPATVTSTLNGSSPVLLSSNNDAEMLYLLLALTLLLPLKGIINGLSFFQCSNYISISYIMRLEFSTIFLISFCIICSSFLLLLLSRSYNL